MDKICITCLIKGSSYKIPYAIIIAYPDVNGQTKYYSVFGVSTIALPSSIMLQHGYSQTTATPVDGISILSLSSFTDDIGAYHFVGEVKITLLRNQ